MKAAKVIRTLGLKPHPEGGWYGETYRDAAPEGERPACTAIYYLLEADQVSAWHRVDSTETWLFHSGAPLKLSLAESDDHPPQIHHLSAKLGKGHRPQFVVPKGWWQSAVSLGDWTLVSCVVAPGFSFDGFELAAPGWAPHGRL